LVFSTASVLTTGLLLLVLVRSRVVVLVVLILAFIPLAIGFLGTLQHYRAISDVIRWSGVNPTPEQLTVGIRDAWMTTWVGVAGTTPLVLMAIVAMVFKGRKKNV
jgi:NhaP-type Na+/H+ or K+/H+ antiporter